MKGSLRRWWDGRAGRERALVGGLLAILVAAMIEALLFAPLRARQAQADRELTAARAHLEGLARAVQQPAGDGADPLQRRQAALQARRERAGEAIRAAQIDLIAPQDMDRELQAMLVRHPGLHITGFSSAAPTPLLEAARDTHDRPAAPAQDGGLYEHDIGIQVEGAYLDLLAYLQELEHAPHRIYWRELDLKVNDKGVAVTHLSLFTLSKDAAWPRP